MISESLAYAEDDVRDAFHDMMAWPTEDESEVEVPRGVQIQDQSARHAAQLIPGGAASVDEMVARAWERFQRQHPEATIAEDGSVVMPEAEQ